MRSRQLSLRWLLLVPVVVAVVAMSLARFALLVQPYLAIQYDVRVELAMVTGQVAFQWLVLWRWSWAERLDYAIVVLGVSMLGALLLWPLLACSALRPVPALGAVAYFFGVVGVMFITHLRLLKRLALPGFLSATWVVYRLLLLVVLVRW